MHLELSATHNYYVFTLTQLTYDTQRHIQGGLPWLGQWAFAEQQGTSKEITDYNTLLILINCIS